MLSTAEAYLTGQVVTAGRVRLKCAVLQLDLQNISGHSNGSWPGIQRQLTPRSAQ